MRIPLGPDGIVLKVRDTWPRTSKVYCHRTDAWPPDADVVERVATRICVRRGASIELVLDRGRESRSQFVLTHAKGREAIFWQSARTAKQARPNVRLPTARAAGTAGAEGPGARAATGGLTILVDTHERYAWRFSHQQVTTRKAPLAAGDYAVEADGLVVAAVERKSLEDLTSSLLDGRLRFALSELSGIPRAAVVVEDRYSRIFALTRVRPAVVADAIAECQARHPAVPIVFAETRALAQEWTYRFLAAARHEVGLEAAVEARLAGLMPAGPVPAVVPTTAQVRAWALEHGYAVADRGRLRPEIWAAFEDRAPQTSAG
ncbi:MAG TPA: ERCC4 domain-containing protein [Intrasporangium sp.]|uniref:ERCC4 domain-containing protein n=1 Tax=Intrasporangium sp. TaxID=1925024 RepID=UPI002D76793F|nr:ERCC4 domain-containing protein [Intrasporangium sp.]HET7398159.1 ERCC4 domain-containing protein [Intrasporangium sp.]